MKWKIKKFSELSTRELHEIYKARTDIFVVEQNCAYPEVDDVDLQSIHASIESEVGKIMGYCRIYPDGDTIRIGRVLVTKANRLEGVGKELMSRAISTVQCRYPNRPIAIQAQSYLSNFYHSFGFVDTSEEYLEDGIPHIDMILESENEM